jgi:hypothetical protein
MRMSQYSDHQITWQGIHITVRHCPRWLSSSADYHVQHIELHVADKEPLPVTETGYRSHFLCGEDALSAFNNDPVAFVTAWLDHEAKARGWQRDRQLSLF